MYALIKSYRWLPWAVAFSIGGALIVLNSYMAPNWLHLNPAENAHRITTRIAIDEFDDGEIENDPYYSERAAALAGILVLFVIGPSLWIFGEIKNQSPHPESDPEEHFRKGAGWYVGVTCVSVALLIFTLNTIKVALSLPDRIEHVEQNRTADQIRYNLAKLGFEAAEKYYLPQELGGGSRNFKTIAPDGEGEPRPLKISDISAVTDDTLNLYLLGPVRADSSLYIYGISHQSGRHSNFENVNGKRGKVQLAVEVLPEGKIIEFDSSAEKRN